MKKLPKSKRLHPDGDGGYGWDHGAIAFGDPMELPKVHEEKKRKAREEWNVKKRARKGLSRSTEFHRKHG